ncbi:uncharacterized protein PRCAT00003217001 [Priceomyces carsonii]|uniref:uncharacterized protein n=1 Tax=Priceomyces carsonii TaxID=28549 RepID=UPI002ED91F0F|nr:unnamed protein product [Priceomyces carsonii]
MSVEPSINLEAGMAGVSEGINQRSGESTPNSSGSKNFSRTPTSWDTQDDILLMHLKDQQKLGWKEIASHFTNRTPNACQFRWRRLKSGNLKNPPKSTSTFPEKSPGVGNNAGKLAEAKGPRKGNSGEKKYDSLNSHTGFASAYSPISNATFTAYDNNISNALADLNALSNTPSNISSPRPGFNASSNIGALSSGGNASSGNDHSKEKDFERSPKSEPSDIKSHRNSNSGAGYYSDMSIDLSYSQHHPHTTQNTLTPRNSASHQDINNPPNNHHHVGQTHNMHQNSIIQIVKDDRSSISFTRASISSLPSKSMNIPHHQLNNNALAHLPILFGSNSVSGPSRNSSISGPIGLLPPSSNVSSLRNGSVVGSGGYYSRSGSVVIPHSSVKKDEDSSKAESKRSDAPKPSKRKNVQPVRSVRSNSSSNSQPMFKIPWSMEEDELLINRRNRELSFAELSILLPQRTEGEIWSRIDYLEKLRNGHRSSTSRENRKRRQSSIGLDVPDFYDEVDDVIGGIGVSEDEDDEVLVDVDDSIHGSKKGRKRRASSAVNPLSVSESIQRRLR